MAARHARVISACTGATLAMVVDRDPDRAAQLADRWGANSASVLTAALRCDLAVVATSTEAHADAALELINAGIPVLVEKPLTSSLAATREVLDAAQARDVALMCGFVERFNSQFLRLANQIGRSISHIDTVRVGPAPQRTHSPVVDDVLLHDLDLVLRLTPGDAVAMITAEASAWCNTRGWAESATCELSMASGITATLHVSRVSEVRRRDIVITSRDSRELRADLLAHAGDPLAAQFERFCWLAQSATETDRDAERASILPSHELAHVIEEQLAGARCDL